MGAVFWIRRFTLVVAGAFVVIAGAQLRKGHTLIYSGMQGLVWAIVSATIFTAARIHQSRKGQHCALCRDTPEMRGGHPDGPG